jgi:hypothetical protein
MGKNWPIQPIQLSSTESIAEALLSYAYHHRDDEEELIIFDFKLLKIVVENANFYGQRLIRPRQA